MALRNEPIEHHDLSEKHVKRWYNNMTPDQSFVCVPFTHTHKHNTYTHAHTIPPPRPELFNARSSYTAVYRSTPTPHLHPPTIAVDGRWERVCTGPSYKIDLDDKTCNNNNPSKQRCGHGKGQHDKYTTGQQHTDNKVRTQQTLTQKLCSTAKLSHNTKIE